ncbi:uncharacterized protein TM35_000291120, partial [Trypanosoma theileri]
RVVKCGDKKDCPTPSSHCKDHDHNVNEIHVLEPSIGTGKEYDCCWRRKLRSVVDERELSFRSSGVSSTKMVFCGLSPSINESKIVKREISSMDNSPFVLKELRALF